jgi:thioredoxin 1
MTVHSISSFQELKNLLATKKFVVIDFFAEWCGPCKKLKPFFSDLAKQEQYANFHFVKCDVDDAEDLATRYGIRGLPTIVFLNSSGSVVDQIIGFNPDGILGRLQQFGGSVSSLNSQPVSQPAQPINTPISNAFPTTNASRDIFNNTFSI